MQQSTAMQISTFERAYAETQNQQTYRSSENKPEIKSKGPSLDVVSHDEGENGEDQTQDCRNI